MRQNEPVTVLIAPLDWGLGHATRCIPIIKEFIDAGAAVIVAASGPGQDLLKEVFPGLVFLEIPGYQISYRRGSLLKWGLLFSIPGFLAKVRKEHDWLNNCLKEYKIDLVLSDNRYGLYHDKLTSVFITHQLYIQSGLHKASTPGILPNHNSETLRSGITRRIDHIILRLNYSLINRFSECWVPDQEGAFSFAGILSHPPVPPAIPLKYIGALSRFAPGAGEIVKNSLVVVLSGPEPQRSQLENILMPQFAGAPYKMTVIRGLPQQHEPEIAIEGVEIFNHLPAEKLNDLLNNAEFIIASAGYSTVMDLLKLGRSAILIPTPGQTEQEYLGRYLAEKKWMYVVSQKNFNLKNALLGYQQEKPVLPLIPESVLKKAVHEVLKNL